ncbi:RNA polymerase sigma factor [Geminisphaera colitermitum]|uniref:RNA polymerase sigma factor n=1 Tax=Geminisphaera colitermitum TaxID=1148786 RepID=UPI0009DDDD62|nr:sigma-70 family RNA polymerase sigma factor [Geminisphaera colitermitum]
MTDATDNTPPPPPPPVGDAAAAPDDEALMLALRDGDDLALNLLMHRWQVPLRHFLERHLQNEHDAHDLAQETFVRIYQHRARWRDGSRFSTWMFQIGLNLTRDRVRWRSHRNHPPLDAARDTASDAPLPAATVELQERAEAVRVAIHALPDDLRATVILSEYEDRSHAEIADIMRTTPKAVETRLYRARQLLRKRLSRWLSC